MPAHPPSPLGRPDAADVVECALALLDLGSRRWASALERLDGLRDPWLSVVSLPDRIEALTRLGSPGEARGALERFRSGTAGAEGPWFAAREACASALLAPDDTAVRSYEAALRSAGASLPFDRARIHLLFGEHLRRRRRRADARVELRAALAHFEAAHATPWAERALAELRASGETARRDPRTTEVLTPQQMQIARLVAEGLSNKDVALRFHLSPRTVENHLRSIFSTLGLMSRTQLAALVLREGAAPAGVAA